LRFNSVSVFFLHYVQCLVFFVAVALRVCVINNNIFSVCIDSNDDG